MLPSPSYKPCLAFLFLRLSFASHFCLRLRLSSATRRSGVELCQSWTTSIVPSALVMVTGFCLRL
jgi:hypothetical protein